MITWEDALKLKVGATLYEEKVYGNYLIFLPKEVKKVSESHLILSDGYTDVYLSKQSFPIDSLYTEE